MELPECFLHITPDIGKRLPILTVQVVLLREKKQPRAQRSIVWSVSKGQCGNPHQSVVAVRTFGGGMLNWKLAYRAFRQHFAANQLTPLRPQMPLDTGELSIGLTALHNTNYFKYVMKIHGFLLLAVQGRNAGHLTLPKSNLVQKRMLPNSKKKEVNALLKVAPRKLADGERTQHEPATRRRRR